MNKDKSVNNTSKVKRKRNRIPLSCTICRKRKVKCDKTHPHCNQCAKTGVQHLCHYMEQSWAEEVEKEMSKDLELKQLRDRVKSLEETLSKVHLSNTYISPQSNNASDSISITHNNSTLVLLDDNNNNNKQMNNLSPNMNRKSSTSIYNKYNDDELDLTIQFDMLHLKNKGTVHLGATHWLAIMKGDPYLKLLWSQIFVMREKLSEWYNQKKLLSQKKHSKNKVALDHSKFKSITNQSSNNVGLVVSHPIPLHSTDKCPIAHRVSAQQPSSNSASIISASSTSLVRKCPIDHTKLQAMKQLGNDYFPKSQSPISIVAGTTNMNHLSSIVTKTSSPLPALLQLPQSTTPKSINSKELSYDQITTRICEFLPPKGVVLLFLEKFFKHIYPVVPILDEQNFKQNIIRILSLPAANSIVPATSDTSKIASLTITRISDYCNLGILLIIMRLTWLSLPPNSCKIDLGQKFNLFGIQSTSSVNVTRVKEENLLLKYEPSVESLILVRKYLIKFDEISSFSNSNVNLITIQFAIFYKLYLKCCSDETNGAQFSNLDPINSTAGQDSETHQVLLSSITQMAFSCGLHRDPDNFPQLNSVYDSQSNINPTNNTHLDSLAQNTTSGNSPAGSNDDNSTGANLPGITKNIKDTNVATERYKHTWRKTWYYIISLDVQQSLSLGTPRLLRNIRDISDTKLPSSSKIDYVRDIKELIIVKNFTLFFQIDLVIISVLNHVLNVSVAKRIRKSKLDELISSLKDLTHNKMSVNDVIINLINKGLLYTSEGTVDQNVDESYGLPSLEEIIYQQGSTYRSGSSVVGGEQEKKLELPHESTAKALLFSKHMTLRILLYLLNYILFTHYEPMATEDPGTTILAKQYAQEALNYAMDGYRNCFYFFNSIKNSNTSDSMFNYMEVMLTPHCLDVGNRGLQFIICLILRAKCGPLTGMGDNTVISGKYSTSASSSSSSSSSSENEEFSDAKDLRKRKISDEVSDDITKHIDLDMNENISDILFSRLLLFNKLTKQIAVKYSFTKRISKSMKFFISLLHHALAKNQSDEKNASLLMSGWEHPKINNMPKTFKNTTQFILSANADQLQRCPIYQDTIGFANNGSGVSNPGIHDQQIGSTQLTRQNSNVQLPALRSYKPITYSKSNVRNFAVAEEIDPTKRRRLNLADGSVDSGLSINELVASPTNGVQFNLPHQNAIFASSTNGMIQGNAMNEVLPPLEDIARSITPIRPTHIGSNSTPNIPGMSGMASMFGNNNNMESNQPMSVMGDDLLSLISPKSESSSASQFIPEFEEFLMQDSNFNNGLLIDASSLCEAVGIRNFEQPDINLTGMDNSDFLPIDNIGITGFQDFNGGNFPLWN